MKKKDILFNEIRRTTLSYITQRVEIQAAVSYERLNLNDLHPSSSKLKRTQGVNPPQSIFRKCPRFNSES